MPLWTPAQITTALWIDFSDSSTLFNATSGGSVVTNGVGIARAEDKSGNSRHFTQSTSGARPAWTSGVQNSLGVARFDGTDDRMSVPSSTAIFNFLHASQGSVFWVAKVGNSSNPNALLPVCGNSGGFSPTRIGFANLIDDRASVPANNRFGAQTYVDNNAVITLLGDDKFTPNTFGLAAVVLDNTNVVAASRGSVFVNGSDSGIVSSTSTAATNSNASFDFFIGDYGTSTFFLLGDFCELVILSSLATLQTRQLTEGYLAWKWGLQGNLPSEHPYKNGAPRYGEGRRQRYAGGYGL